MQIANIGLAGRGLDMNGKFNSTWSSALAFGGVVIAQSVLAGVAHADVTISAATTKNMNCTGGVCAPTAAKAVLNASDLQSMLASGNVTITTTGSGIEADNIVVSSPFSWSSSNSLALEAYESIAIGRAVSVSGPGGLSLTTNNGGSSGTLSFGLKGNVAFAGLSNALAINGTPYTLVGSVPALAGAVGANPAGNYALASDYDAAGDGTYGTAPVATMLTGTVEGLGNTISGLTIKIAKGKHASPDFGLFAQVGRGGAVSSLKMTGFNIMVESRSKGTSYGAGAMVGLNLGSLFDDHTAGALFTKGGGGGLVGQNVGIIGNSSSDARVSGPAGGGGLVFWNSDGEVTESYATGAVSGGNKAVVGGLAAINASVVYNSYAAGAASGGPSSETGGLNGLEDFVSETSYSTGQVSGGLNSYVGGFAGFNDGVGDQECYWDTTTSGADQGTGNGENAGITGLTTEQLQSSLPAGFDPTIWAESPRINHGLPYLIANPPK
jgi:hypothetical protein